MDISVKVAVLLTIWSSAELVARNKTDAVLMANGDRFTCEIKRLERGVLYGSLGYVDGTVSIEWFKSGACRE